MGQVNLSVDVASRWRGRACRWRRLALLLALLLCVMRAPAFADGQSGPERTTIIAKSWGTVYHLPFSPGTLIQSDMLGEYVIKAPNGGLTSLKQEGYESGYVIYFPDKSTMMVRISESGELLLEIGETRAWFRIVNDGWVLKLPTDEVRLRKHGKEVRLSGRLGTTVVTDDGNGFTIKSPAGETSYSRASFDEPYRLTGLPVQAHPYVVRGLWCETSGMGFFVDFKLGDYSRAFSVLGWQPMMGFGGK
ncbi:MAG: hypothetical protein EB084_26550 [Proteobacteria bacterium]|nr:hypothetical protein [Pseudomonadota bacterium]